MAHYSHLVNLGAETFKMVQNIYLEIVQNLCLFDSNDEINVLGMQLGFRLSHILRRSLPIAFYLLQASFQQVTVCSH